MGKFIASRRRALLLGDCPLLDAEHRGRRHAVEVLPLLEGLHEAGVVRDLGKDPKFDLGVIGDDEDVALLGDEAAPELVLVRYLLDIRRGAGETAGRDPALQEVRVDAPGLRVYEARVGLQVGAELLLQLAVLEEVSGRLVVNLQERPHPRVWQLDAYLAEGVGDLLRAVQVEPGTQALERQYPVRRREVRLEPLGRPVAPLAHGFFEFLPPRDVELDAGELHLRYRRYRPELYLRDGTELFLLHCFRQPFAQRQEDRGVAGGVLKLLRRQLPRPVLAAGRLFPRLVQAPLPPRP